MRRLAREIWRTRFGKFAAVVLAANVLVWLGARLGLRLVGPGAKTFLRFLLLFCVVYLVARYFGRIRRGLLWRLRNRLLIAYVFIAIIPILLILSMVSVAAYLLYGQLATYLVVNQLERDVGRLRAANLALVVDLSSRLRQNEMAGPAATAVLESYRQELVAEFPGLECGVLLPGGRSVVVPADHAALFKMPEWLKQEFHGLTKEESRLYLRSVRRTSAGGKSFVVQLTVPVSPEFLDRVGRDVGRADLILLNEVPRAEAERGQTLLAIGDRRFVQGEVISDRRRQLPRPAHRFDFYLTGFSTYDVADWDAPGREPATIPILLSIASRPSLLNRKLFSTLGALSSLPFAILLVIGIVFLVIEFFSLVTGIVLTRTITGAVSNLYEATQRVKVGDFSYRIPYRADDQLGALAGSFNTMTESIEGLIQESKEKQRLEGELEIAREVQAQLFPKSVPTLPTLELAAACRPARVVSGDYYDFLQIGSDRLGLAVADISGKGISAALLMASVQSALRTHVYTDGHGGLAEGGTAEMVARLNRQLFENTPMEKYATLCYAVYDASRRSLTYTNAGHLPPLLFADGRVRRLEVGGTVIGLFPEAEYEQDEVVLRPGAILVTYSDGITEPENSFGEQFGEGRLIELIERFRTSSADRIVREVLAALDDWKSSPEQDDDMTLLVARVL